MTLALTEARARQEPPAVNGADGALSGSTPETSTEETVTAARKRAPVGGYTLATVECVRRLVVETPEPLTAIAIAGGVSATTVKNWLRRYGWTRPAGAPPLAAPRAEFDPAIRRARLAVRLYRALGRQLGKLERRERGTGGATAEKDARTLGLLARTLATMTALDRDDGAGVNQAEPVDRDEIDADLARRIARWAAGGEGTE